MFGYDWPRLHAAVNDLPAALLLVTVLFDFGAGLTRRESLRAAALWTLWAGVIGGWVAVLAGLQAEDAIDHGEAIHELLERHELWGYITMGVFTALLLWKLWRRAGRSPAEEWALRALSVAGVVGLVLVASIGGRLVFEHAAGIPNDRMTTELIDRGVNLTAPPPEPAAPDSAKAPGHTHAPGTKPHRH